MTKPVEVLHHNSAAWLARDDYRKEGCFNNPYLKNTNAWRAYHAVESHYLLKEIRGEK